MAVDTMKVSEMAERILAIPGGEDPDPVEISINTSTGLVTATDGVTSDELQLTVQAANTVTPGTSAQTAVASQRYTTGAVIVAGDADLVASNIKKDVEIFGVTGSLNTPTTPFTFSINSSTGAVTANDGVYSSIYNQPTASGSTFNVLGTVSSADQVLVDGGKFLRGQVKIAQEPNFSSSNIKKGVTMWGTTGSYSANRTTYASSAAEVLSDGRTGFKYALPSDAPAGMPDLIMVNSQIADPATFLDVSTWAPGSCAYLWAGSYFRVVGTWFYKASGGTFANSMQNAVLPQAACQITREDNDLIFTLGTYLSLYSPLAKITGNSHKAYCVWF